MINKNSILTISKREVNVFDPKPEMFDIEDIAHALSNICRFTGHIPKRYTVAQHCVLCAKSSLNEYKMAALLHDASEAYLNDIASPIKEGLPEYVALEDSVMKCISEKFEFEYPLPKPVVLTDKIYYNIERRTFRDTDEEGLTLNDVWSQKKAYKEFIKMFKNLENS
jgi:hypothetical protein